VSGCWEHGPIGAWNYLIIFLFLFSPFNIDMAAKRHKRHKNKISELVISMGYNE
jgi:hypothetical protein